MGYKPGDRLKFSGGIPEKPKPPNNVIRRDGEVTESCPAHGGNRSVQLRACCSHSSFDYVGEALAPPRGRGDRTAWYDGYLAARTRGRLAGKGVRI